jgi:hypothetical protein
MRARRNRGLPLTGRDQVRSLWFLSGASQRRGGDHGLLSVTGSEMRWVDELPLQPHGEMSGVEAGSMSWTRARC